MNNKTEKIQLDPIKMLLFFLILVLISLFLIFILIVPSAKEYKSVKIMHQRHDQSITRLQNIIGAKANELDDIVKNNSKILDALVHSFDKQNFLTYANNFFQNVKLQELKKLDKNPYILYELNVTSSIKTPSNFYNFLDGLKQYQNIIKVTYPISMQSVDKNIHASFLLKIYNAK